MHRRIRNTLTWLCKTELQIYTDLSISLVKFWEHLHISRCHAIRPTHQTPYPPVLHVLIPRVSSIFRCLFCLPRAFFKWLISPVLITWCLILAIITSNATGCAVWKPRKYQRLLNTVYSILMWTMHIENVLSVSQICQEPLGLYWNNCAYPITRLINPGLPKLMLMPWLMHSALVNQA